MLRAGFLRLFVLCSLIGGGLIFEGNDRNAEAVDCDNVQSTINCIKQALQPSCNINLAISITQQLMQCGCFQQVDIGCNQTTLAIEVSPSLLTVPAGGWVRFNFSAGSCCSSSNKAVIDIDPVPGSLPSGVHYVVGSSGFPCEYKFPASAAGGTFKYNVSIFEGGVLCPDIPVNPLDPYIEVVNQSSPGYTTTWGNPGSSSGQFASPYGLVVSATGKLYVCDTFNHRIQVFDSDGTYLNQWGSNGTGNGQFNAPTGIAVDVAGNVFVGESGNRIQKFAADGAFVTKWGTSGSGDGQFNLPRGVAVDGSGNVYVVEQGNQRVQKFDNNGVFQLKWGSLGSGDGQFNNPWGIDTDSENNVYVAETNNNRIQKFTSSGVFVMKWGSAGSGNGQFNNPRGVDVDAAGMVYVTDLNDRVQKFTSDGTFVTSWGGSGNGSGQFNDPQDVGVDSDGGCVYVADQANNRIQKFCKACSPPPQNLTAWWPLDEASGTVALEQLGHAHGSYVGGASHSSGKASKGVHVGTGTQYVSVLDNPNLNFSNHSFSISAWVRTGDPNSSTRTIVDKRQSGPLTGYSLFMNNGFLGFQLADPSGSTNYTSSSHVLTDGAWHHVAVTVNRVGGTTGGDLYVDGVGVLNFNPTLRPGSLTNSGNLTMGQAFDGSSGDFNGDIDEVELYDRNLNSFEIAELFLVGGGGNCKSATVTGTPEETPRDNELSLFRVMGNPVAKGDAVIAFTLQKADRLKMEVYDVAGRLLHSQDAGLLDPGQHTVSWDGRTDGSQEVRTGVYFIKLSLSDSRIVETKRIVFMK